MPAILIQEVIGSTSNDEASKFYAPPLPDLDSNRTNLEQNQLKKIYRAKTPRRKEKNLFISPNLARFMSLREIKSSASVLHQKFQISLARSLEDGDFLNVQGKWRGKALTKSDQLRSSLCSFDICRDILVFLPGAQL
jgi:hypothetical protein